MRIVDPAHESAVMSPIFLGLCEPHSITGEPTSLSHLRYCQPIPAAPSRIRRGVAGGKPLGLPPGATAVKSRPRGMESMELRGAEARRGCARVEAVDPLTRRRTYTQHALFTDTQRVARASAAPEGGHFAPSGIHPDERAIVCSPLRSVAQE